MDRTVTQDSPGEIKLSAENSGNETSFHVEIKPVGDYTEIVKVTDREGNPRNQVDLGTAVQGATTAENFVQVRKKLNVTSNVRIKAKLYNEESSESLDTRIYQLSVQED